MVPKTKKPEHKDHRAIALTNVGYKIFMSLVKDKIVEHIRHEEEQSELKSGFTGGRRLKIIYSFEDITSKGVIREVNLCL